MYVLKQGIFQRSLSNYFIQPKGTKGLSDTIPWFRKGTPSPNIPGATRNIFICFMSGALNQERATPIQGLCHGVFTDQFSFKHILGYFFRENRISTMSMEN